MTDERRRPTAFRLDPPETIAAEPHRAPRAIGLGTHSVEETARDVFDEPEQTAEPPVPRRSRGGLLGKALATGFGILFSLALGLWTDALLRDLFARAEWLGWVGSAAALLGLSALLIIVLREALALRRLASVEHMRARAREVLASGDGRAARALAGDLSGLFAGRPETAAGRKALSDLRDEVVDADTLLRLAEVELLGPLDARARTLVLDAAKRVSLVTAVSPRAVFDVLYVAWEASRLLRRLAELYGGRPGTLGFFRLARSALAHLAVTGSIAAGDSVIHQLVGQGLAARLSAKLGEGVVNGMMTARVGVAAMEAARPLPFSALQRPGMGDFLQALARFTAKERDSAG